MLNTRKRGTIKWVLPPKRWEDASHVRWDPIRWKPWFHRLLERKHQIPKLTAAWKYALDNPKVLQKTCAEEFGVDARELRDFIKFKHNQNPEILPWCQQLADKAYSDYCLRQAEFSYHQHLVWCARAYARPARALKELWEVCPDFYPSGYER